MPVVVLDESLCLVVAAVVEHHHFDVVVDRIYWLLDGEAQSIPPFGMETDGGQRGCYVGLLFHGKVDLYLVGTVADYNRYWHTVDAEV